MATVWNQVDAAATTAATKSDSERIRADFPVLETVVNGNRLVYLDSAATSHKPMAVVDRLARFMSHENATVRRGVHYLSERATFAHDQSRSKVAAFIGAGDPRQVIFTRGTTDSINLVAAGFERSILKPGDEVLITHMEHHANIVPWQMACERSGAKLVVAPITEAGELDLEALEAEMSERTRIVAVTHVSNALGTINPVKAIIEMAHARGIPVLVDGAQAVPHMKVDVGDLGCDFYAFSGHKMLGPTGIGVLFGTTEWLERLPPYQGGGDMILSVTFEKTVYNVIPHKFEAGTPAIAEAIGLGAAIDYMNAIGLDAISAHEHDLLEYATAQLGAIEGVRLIGTAREKAAVVSFTVEGIHPHDIGTILDQDGIAIRVGHHCAQPVMQFYGVPATARASFAVYNTRSEVDALVTGVQKCIEVFR
ncbi:MAG: cysteine desulfurase [Blastocatellia bacterium]|nr:cysteine desulfurase [Blastocatellia bacterium]